MREPLQFALWHTAARIAGWLRRPAIRRLPASATEPAAPSGISVVIPSRNGRSLLAAQLPGIARELAPPSEAIVVDNGSADSTAEWLAAEWPQVEVEVSAEPLSFAAAVNRGIARARYSHVCLLNNDMLLEPGFFTALLRAFDRVPGLFCSTAQIRFPAGVRREETGKAVMAQDRPDDFPVRCDEPLAGEDLTWVLYGSGGCSLYDAAMLRALGGVDEAYAPAYVEDLDLGYRAWQRGWPTVFVAGAVVEHRHRATTSRYYTERQLAEILEINYLRFLTRAEMCIRDSHGGVPEYVIRHCTSGNSVPALPCRSEVSAASDVPVRDRPVDTATAGRNRSVTLAVCFPKSPEPASGFFAPASKPPMAAWPAIIVSTWPATTRSPPRSPAIPPARWSSSIP